MGNTRLPESIGPAFTELVQQALAEFFDEQSALVGRVGPAFTEAVRELRDFVLRGGKRTRPAFAWAGWLGAGGDPAGPEAPAVLRACAALELVQAGALIHDDIIDASDTRRGFPTVHVAFTERHRAAGWIGDAPGYGRSVAVLLGDLALAWADDMLRGSGLGPAAQARLTPPWAAMRTEVLGGQLLDITGEAAGDESLDAALRINRYKTAAYTVERPLHLGAAIAGADDRLIEAYRVFGTDIGIAFQLRDDLLGVFGDPVVTGKPSGDDLRTGKRTALLAIALERADATDPVAAARLRDRIGAELTDAEVTELRELITGLGAVDVIEHRIAELTDAAHVALTAAAADAAATGRLWDMAVAATRRTW